MINLAKFTRNVVSRDPQRRLSALKIFGDWVLGDYRMSWHQLDWWHDTEFNAYLDQFGERSGFNTHRKWALWQLLRLTAAVDGDTAECGVFEGASSWLICAANRQFAGQRIHHLFDSFEGLSKPDAKDGSYWTVGDLARDEELVSSNLKPFLANIEFHKGWIPERFADVESKTFSFVHIDVDLYQPTLDSVRFFYDRLCPGAIVLCDDYAFSSCPGATRAIDEFLADKQEKMITLSSGGGFFIKGISVATSVGPLG